MEFNKIAVGTKLYNARTKKKQEINTSSYMLCLGRDLFFQHLCDKVVTMEISYECLSLEVL